MIFLTSFPIILAFPRLERPLALGIREVRLYRGSTSPQTLFDKTKGVLKGGMISVTVTKQCGSLVGQPMLHFDLVS